VIAAPAVDLKDGRCVQLVGGRPDSVAVSLPDPVAAAARWRAAGFGTLHIVDLDAALGLGDNLDVILDVIRSTSATIQVGGGVRDDARAGKLLDAGVARIVVGTRALDDPKWLIRLAEAYPRRIMVALDTKDGRILRRGWTEESPLDIATYLPSLAELPLAGILSTNVAREGRLQGIDREACREVIEMSSHGVWASGGVTTMDELAFLDEAGAAGVVLGMALYTDTLNAADVAARWGGANTAKAR
jgi:phosphoribosylformimino-5-aminoimidazole carboxamide ribotide isomerase